VYSALPIIVLMKKTPLKANKISLKKSPLKAKVKGLKSNNKSLVKLSCLKKGNSTLSNDNNELQKTELKKQNEKAKAKWLAVREEVLKRDNHKCVVCGKPATQVHHIHLRSKRKDLIYEINNLVSLCNKHHDHQSLDGLEKVNRRIAEARHISLEQLLRFAEITEQEE